MTDSRAPPTARSTTPLNAPLEAAPELAAADTGDGRVSSTTTETTATESAASTTRPEEPTAGGEL